MAAASPSLLVTAVLTHTSVLPYSGRGGARRGWREGEREREGSVDIQELVINDNFTTHLSSMIPPFLPLASTVFPSPPRFLSQIMIQSLQDCLQGMEQQASTGK